MFTMIFVNDLAGAPESLAPSWIRHYHGKSGMTFVDLVFPAFLFIVGMSIPIALGSRLDRGEPAWKALLHVLARTGSLLVIGILMVHETPDSEKLGWSGQAWCVGMYLSAMTAFGAGSFASKNGLVEKSSLARVAPLALQVLGWAGMIFLAWTFRGAHGERILTIWPFSVNTSWYGILGLIGWAYLVSSMVFLVFRHHRTALLGCVALLLCLYPADQAGLFKTFWIASHVGIGSMLGSQAAITCAGALLASILLTPETRSLRMRAQFTGLFIAGCGVAAMLLEPLYGINKNRATPSWCLWACAITASLWLLFYFLADVSSRAGTERIVKPFMLAGQNVLLAYLLSEMLPSVLTWIDLAGWYDRLCEVSLVSAVARSVGCALILLSFTVILNRAGFRLRL
jgi:predicted acyltransferase